MAFLDVSMPPRVLEEFSGGPEYKTTIVSATSGYEQRNIDRLDAIWRYSASAFIKDDVVRRQMIAFFLAVKGRAHSWRFRDNLDFWTGTDWDGDSVLHLDADQQTPFAEGDGSTPVFQLWAPYETLEGLVTLRKMTKPAKVGSYPGYAGPKVYVENGSGDMVERVGGWSIDTSTGLLSFSSGTPAAGRSIAWSGLFDVHARFDTDQLNLAAIDSSPVVNNWQGVTVVGVLD